MEGRPRRSDQGGGTAGLALLAAARATVCRCSSKRSAADTAEVSLALRMALSVEGVECQPK
jgi:hypothetical protein